MTTPRIADEFNGPRIHVRGMVRDRPMPADAPIACSRPENLPLFDLMFDVRWAEPAKSEKGEEHRRRVYRATKAICKGCPVRETCLTVHGPDLELGVVGGATDAERAKLFGGAA